MLVDLACMPPLLWKLNKMLISIMQIPSKNEPIIIGFRRPYRSKKKDGKRDPIANMAFTQPPKIRDKLRLRPTLSCRTEVM